uniref:Uncharacterized protein n=1 Tax=Siphoviridae sp. ctWWc42 TaxID=2826361 RepID=A0A8S5R1B8_9CAUD|nr:MAG TPA: hypothetical protein [Siphoviridae sp. ctWWc42]
MLKKTITYTDYDGVERTEDFYFNFTEAELMEWQLVTNGGLTSYVQKIVDAKDQPRLITLFKELLLKAYGVKSDDGRRFIKSEEISEEFSQNPAYSILYMELVTDDKVAADFVNGIIPAKLSEQVSEQNSRQSMALIS